MTFIIEDVLEGIIFDDNNQKEVDVLNDYLFIINYTEILISDWGKYYNDNKASPEVLNIIKQHLNKTELERFFLTVNDITRSGRYFEQDEYDYNALIGSIISYREYFLKELKYRVREKFYYLQRLYKIRN